LRGFFNKWSTWETEIEKLCEFVERFAERIVHGRAVAAINADIEDGNELAVPAAHQKQEVRERRAAWRQAR